MPAPQVFPRALRPKGHPLTDRFPNALIQPLLRISMHSFSQKTPPQFERLPLPAEAVKSPFFHYISLSGLPVLCGFMLSIKQINHTVLIVCILHILAAFPEKADTLLLFHELYFLPYVLVTHGDIVLFFIVIFRPNVVSLHKCPQ